MIVKYDFDLLNKMYISRRFNNIINIHKNYMAFHFFNERNCKIKLCESFNVYYMFKKYEKFVIKECEECEKYDKGAFHAVFKIQLTINNNKYGTIEFHNPMYGGHIIGNMMIPYKIPGCAIFSFKMKKDNEKYSLEFIT